MSALVQSNIDGLHRAAEVIETGGIDRFQTAVGMVGYESALALLIAHLRHDEGSEESYPPPACIEEAVNKTLRKHGLC